jgi:hypothetical protein
MKALKLLNYMFDEGNFQIMGYSHQYRQYVMVNEINIKDLYGNTAN